MIVGAAALERRALRLPRRHAAASDLSFDRRDSASGMPKCQVIDPAFTWGDDRRPNVPWQDTVIYELHVKRLHDAPSRGAAAAARHLRRARDRARSSST